MANGSNLLSTEKEKGALSSSQKSMLPVLLLGAGAAYLLVSMSSKKKKAKSKTKPKIDPIPGKKETLPPVPEKDTDTGSGNVDIQEDVVEKVAFAFDSSGLYIKSDTNVLSQDELFWYRDDGQSQVNVGLALPDDDYDRLNTYFDDSLNQLKEILSKAVKKDGWFDSSALASIRDVDSGDTVDWEGWIKVFDIIEENLPSKYKGTEIARKQISKMMIWVARYAAILSYNSLAGDQEFRGLGGWFLQEGSSLSLEDIRA